MKRNKGIKKKSMFNEGTEKVVYNKLAQTSALVTFENACKIGAPNPVASNPFCLFSSSFKSFTGLCMRFTMPSSAKLKHDFLTSTSANIISKSIRDINNNLIGSILSNCKYAQCRKSDFSYGVCLLLSFSHLEV